MSFPDPSSVASAIIMISSIATAGLSWCGDLLVAAIVLGGLVMGARAGLFRGTIAGVSAFAALVVSLALGDVLAQRLVGMDVSPRVALGITFPLLLAAMATCMRRFVVELIPHESMRLHPLIDLIGGSAVGAAGGVVIAGIALVSWSILPLPPRFRIDPAAMTLDAGTTLLAVFAHCVTHDHEEASVLLAGESREAPGFPRRLRASETFVDRDANGRHDAGEEYLDADNNHAFSPRRLFHDANGNGRRDIGLLERYRLGRWDHVVSLSEHLEDEASLLAAPDHGEGNGTQVTPAADSAGPAR